MTITGSASPPYVITDVISKLQGASALAGVLVRWGLLSTLPTERERIYLLGTNNYTRHRQAGYPVRVENYDVRGIVEVSLITQDPVDVSTRVWELIDAIDLTLLDDPDFMWARYTGELRIITDDIFPTSEGWIGRATFRAGMSRMR
jgi:hypothetical protein